MAQADTRDQAEADAVGLRVVELAEALVELRDVMPMQRRWSGAAAELCDDAARFIKNARPFGLAPTDWS